jgi:hypothetical protein
MYFMRDLHIAYDGTVRNAYGNQLVQFSYDIDRGISTADTTTNNSFGKSIINCGGGQPVGALSACAISEAAYSALDQPVSLLETSPLLNLKVLPLSSLFPLHLLSATFNLLIVSYSFMRNYLYLICIYNYIYRIFSTTDLRIIYILYA